MSGGTVQDVSSMCPHFPLHCDHPVSAPLADCRRCLVADLEGDQQRLLSAGRQCAGARLHPEAEQRRRRPQAELHRDGAAVGQTEPARRRLSPSDGAQVQHGRPAADRAGRQRPRRATQHHLALTDAASQRRRQWRTARLTHLTQKLAAGLRLEVRRKLLRRDDRGRLINLSFLINEFPSFQ